MNVQAIADLHGFLPKIPPCDLLLIAGDVCPDFLKQRKFSVTRGVIEDRGEIAQSRWLHKEFRAWLEEVPADYIIGIAGNHDFVFDKTKFLIPRDLPWTYLLDSETEIDGLRIHGIPWVPHLPAWAFSLPDDRLRFAYEAITENTDVVISHGPPLGYLDLTVPRFGELHAGAEAANEMLHRVTPQVFVCGHIHEGRGHANHKSGTALYNVAHVDENYAGFRGPAQIVEL